MTEFRLSKTKHKKYDAYYNGHWIPFGDNRYSHYYDRIGYYNDLNHLDKDRRRLYRARASAIKDKHGKLTYTDKNSANYWAYHYLW